MRQRFHAWAASQVNQRAEVVRLAIQKFNSKAPLTEKDYLHTRYRLDGSEGGEEAWPNFQLDGFGTWLWALHEHYSMNGFPLAGR